MKIEKTYRTLFLILLTMGLCSFIKAQNNNKTKLEDELLNGKVKSLKVKSFKLNKTLQDTVLNYELVVRFNDLCLLVESKGLEQISRSKYNSKNQLIQVNVCRWNGKDCTVNYYFYDKKGNLIKHFSKHPPSTSSMTVYYEYFITNYSYDKQNNLIEEKSYNKPVKSKKVIFGKHKIFEYDSKGNKIIEKKLSQSGTVFEKNEYKYLDTTLIEIYTWMTFEGENLYLRDIYEYFESGKIKSKTSLIYDYNTKDQVVKKYITLYTYEFDNKNRLIKEIVSASGILKKEYSNFDKKDNWQKRIDNNNGEVEIILRQFEYYE